MDVNETAAGLSGEDDSMEEKAGNASTHQEFLTFWLFDEARRRGLSLAELASSLGVTYGYLAQLRTGVRAASRISPAFVRACAKFLRVMPIAVKLAAGQITPDDFVSPEEGAEDAISRKFARMLDDGIARAAIAPLSANLTMEAKAALLALYAALTGIDEVSVWHYPRAMHGVAEIARDGS